MAEKSKRKMKLSPEERLRRSEQAKAQVARGQIGGARKGAGRPKKQRAQEAVADKIRNESNAIFKALKEALTSESPSIKLKAALAMLEIETKESEHQIKEEARQFRNLDREQLEAAIKERLATLDKAGINFDPDALANEVEKRREQKLLEEENA